MGDPQQKRELEIELARQFIKCANLSDDLDSIENRPEPEADIMYSNNNTDYYLELTSLDDDTMHTNISEYFSLLKFLHQENRKHPYKNELYRKSISISLCYEVDIHRKQCAREIIAFLHSGIFNNYDSYPIELSPNIHGVISISISPTSHIDTLFELNGPGGWYNEEMISKIKKKLSKTYKTLNDGSIGLLCYYMHQRPPDDDSKGLYLGLRMYLEEKFKLSPFDHLWIFDTRDECILFEYPDNY
ncbi:MAG: hypothetical protein ACM3UZ_15670 [Acidobacteriota bacterium]